MVFTTGTLQHQHCIHRRHLLESIFKQLHSSRARRCIPTRAADDQSPSLASRPQLRGPPKRNARPNPPPAPPHRDQQDFSRPRSGPGDNGNRSFSSDPQQRQNPRAGPGDGQHRPDFQGKDNRQFNEQDNRQNSYRQDRDGFQGRSQDARPSSPAGRPSFPPQSRSSADARPPQQPDSPSSRSASAAAPSGSNQNPANPQRPRPPPGMQGRPVRPPGTPRGQLNRPMRPQMPQEPQRQELRASNDMKAMDKFIDRMTDPHRPPPRPQQRPGGPSSPMSRQSSDYPAQPNRPQQPRGGPLRPQRPQAAGSGTLAPPPRPQTADAPFLAPRPGMRPGPRPGPNRQGSVDIDAYAASRGRQNQNRSMDGPYRGDPGSNGAGRPPPRQGGPAQRPPMGRQAQPAQPGMPPPDEARPSGGKAKGKKRSADDEAEDDKLKARGRRFGPQAGRQPFGGRAAGRGRGPPKPRETKAERKQRREDAQEKLVKEDIIEVGLEGMSVEELGRRIAVDPEDIVVALFMKGVAAQVNQVLDFETVEIAASAFEVEIIEKDEAKVDDAARKTTEYTDEQDLEHLEPRPPVVVVMGHVDHGKTSLLDTIRKSKVAAGEAGGITQAIGAYTVPVDTDADVKAVTFLDTPGHEAFSAMRARGARVTDIAIIVVAADDGVRPQTLEAVSHAKAAGVPIVVAINKIDKEGANPERVKQEMSEAGLLPEEWGGKTPYIEISAKKGTGVDDLLETVAIVAEVEQLMSNPTKPAAGTVLEAHLDRRIGAIATLLVQTGTLKIGDVVVAGAAYGKVRSMKDNAGDQEEATASTAVQMAGLNAVPVAGDDFTVATSLDEGRKLAESAGSSRRMDRLSLQAGGGSMITTTTTTHVTMDGDDEEDHLRKFNVILKADASGSLEAVKAALNNLPQGSVVLRYLLALPNEITVSDVDLAAASQGLILGFNVEPSEAVQTAAKQQGVTIQTYKVIYNLLDDMRDAMEGKLTALEQRVPVGAAEVRAVFGKGSNLVAGCMVTEGLLRDDSFIVVTRKKKTAFEGNISSLRRVKEIVKSVENGNECGVGCKDFSSWEDGDKIEAFEVVNRRRTLEDKVAPRSFQIPDEWLEDEEQQGAEEQQLALQGR